jgi:hypothetical protein
MVRMHNFPRVAQKRPPTANVDSLRRAVDFAAVRCSGKSRGERILSSELHLERDFLLVDGAS